MGHMVLLLLVLSKGMMLNVGVNWLSFPSAGFGCWVCVRHFKQALLEKPQELSIHHFYRKTQHWWGGLISNSLPLNLSTKLSSTWEAGKTERVHKSQKAEQGEGCTLSCVCAHLYNDITGDACLNGVSMSDYSFCRQNNIPEKADQGDFMLFFSLLDANSGWLTT